MRDQDVVVMGMSLRITLPRRVRGWRRLGDLGVAVVLGVLLLPAGLGIALYVAATTGCPVVVRELVGHGVNGPVYVHRFGSDDGSPGAAQLDRYGLRELPALVDLARGDLSLFAGFDPGLSAPRD